MRSCSLLAAAALAACPAAAEPLDPAPVIAAERAFAARAAQVGVGQSFLEFMADDAIVFAPGPVSAKALYKARPKAKSPNEGGTLLAWWPNWAGIARSGELGFTTGPAEVNGKRSVNYFTIWRKQADGRWRWVYDGGASDASGGAPREAPVAVLADSAARSMYPEHAEALLKAEEATLAAVASLDTAKAYEDVLAPEARLQGPPGPPATTPETVRAAIASRPAAIAFTSLGRAVSKTGDLAWTYGEAHWARGGAPGAGHYVRVWQRRPEGWRLVFEQLQDDAPTPPSKP